MSKKLRCIIGILWTVFISVLFCLPGKALPKADWLSEIYFDKWVHIGFFTILIFLWSWFLEASSFRLFFASILIAILYGFVVELVQHYLIPHRSFDLGDLLADTVGALLGLAVWSWYIKK